MSKNVKKTKRRLAILRLRAGFLGVKGVDRMGITALCSHIHAVTGTLKFLTYILSANKLSLWEAYKKKASRSSAQLKRYLREEKTLDNNLSREKSNLTKELYCE